MNCKQGDVAVIVPGGTYPENTYAWVEVVRPYVYGELLPGHAFNFSCDDEPSWVVRSLGRRLVCNRGAFEWLVVRDKFLRPIRPQSDDARDESLVWLPPVPTTTEEPA